MTQLVKSTNYYALLLFHLASKTLQARTGQNHEDYKALRVKVKSIGAQVFFSSILPVREKDAAGNTYIMKINSDLVLSDIMKVLAFMKQDILR